MKINLFSILLTGTMFINSLSVPAQDNAGRVVPSVNIKTLSGENFNTSKFSNDGKPMVIDFWATWCKPCLEELGAIHEVYSDWQKETGVKLIAVSVDDSRTMNRVAPLVNGKNWTYETYLDPNGDFKRALNVNMPPQTFVLNGKGEIVWEHVGFAEGNQDELHDVILKVAAGKPVGESK